MIQFDKISKTFHPHTVNAQPVFKDFSLSIPDGQFVSIIGSNGSGKTTLLNVLCGTTRVDSGRVILDGQNISQLPDYQRYGRMGRVFQDPSLGVSPKMTVLENLALADNKGRRWGLKRAVDEERIGSYEESLARFGLGLEGKLNEAVGSLSGGQRQAVSLLMATMTPISYLILDEHTAALDPKTADSIMHFTDQMIREKGMTALMVTHNLRYALAYGDRLLMLHQGEVVMDRVGKKKEATPLEELLEVFDRISIEKGNSI